MQSLIDRLAVPENGPAGSIRSGYCDILAELPGASGNTGRAWQETLRNCPFAIPVQLTTGRMTCSVRV